MAIAKTAVQAHVADFLGWTDDDSQWTTLEEARLDRILDLGYRMYMHPPRINERDDPHRWGWLRDTYHVELNVNERSYFTPANFSFVVGPVMFSEEVAYQQDYIQEIGWGDLMTRESTYGSQQAGRPLYYAINRQPATIHNPESNSSSSSDSFTEVVSLGTTIMRFYPKPDKAYKIHYEYEKTATSFGSTSLGPDEWNALLQEACLAQAEKEMNDSFGIHYQAFLAMLDELIELDKRRNPHTMDNIGKMRPTYNRHNGKPFDPRYRHQTVTITHENQS